MSIELLHYSEEFARKEMKSTKRVTREEFLGELYQKGLPLRIIGAFAAVDRSIFMPSGIKKEYAYARRAWFLRDNDRSTAISQPGLVATMTDMLDIREGHKVLEIGTATGYQAAILKRCVGSSGSVTSVEIDEQLCEVAKRNIAQANVGDVTIVHADGSIGYPPNAPYDRILSTASFPLVDFAYSPIANQLAIDGILVAPFGFKSEREGLLVTVQRQDKDKFEVIGVSTYDVSFVPAVGEKGWNDAYFQGLEETRELFRQRCAAKNHPVSEDIILSLSIIDKNAEILQAYGWTQFDHKEYLRHHKLKSP